jgi:hypothetical protein
MSDLLKTYEQLHYEVSVLPYELHIKTLPQLLIITPLMKANFLRYGRNQFCSFDLTHTLFR